MNNQLANIALALAIVSLVLSAYSVYLAGERLDRAAALIEAIANVEASQATMQANWTSTSAELNRGLGETSQALEELYVNQEIIAEYVGVAVEDTAEAASEDE